jgi:hypothetical protein
VPLRLHNAMWDGLLRHPSSRSGEQFLWSKNISIKNSAATPVSP